MSYRITKRFFDIFFSVLAIAVLLLPWIIIIFVIKKQSPGPVFFKPERVGKDGKLFTMLKFRSMQVDSGTIRATTLRNDKRIFPFGAFLRKSKLDETPQFINILKGEMSVIGPRPEDSINADKVYLGEYKELLSVKPGLSSPASLYDYTHGEAYENEEDYLREFQPKKLALDLYYVKNRNILYDLQIIWRTVFTIIQIMIGKKVSEPKELEIVNKYDVRN